MNSPTEPGTDQDQATPETPPVTAPTGKAAKAPKTAPAPGRWKVRLSHPESRKRVVFSSISERRARDWLMRRCPRAEEMYLETPAGGFYSYVVDRLNDDGTDAESWSGFDPDQYVPSGDVQSGVAAGNPDIEG